MDTLTLGQISITLAFIVGLWISVETLSKKISTLNEKALTDALKPTNDKLDKLSKKMDDVDLNSTKNFLVSSFLDVEMGHVDEVTISRIYEQYEHYIKLGGNSYIKDRFDKLKKNNKI